jgi:hypothetical protein
MTWWSRAGDPTVPERQRAGDPSFVLMVTHDIPGASTLVQSTAISHPRAAAVHRDDLAER